MSNMYNMIQHFPLVCYIFSNFIIVIIIVTEWSIYIIRHVKYKHENLTKQR